MNQLINTIWKLRIWKDTRGQDFYEYALIAAFIATAWATVTPGTAAKVSTVFSKVSSTLTKAGG